MNKPADSASQDGVAGARETGGESNGGAYPNPHTGKEGGKDGGGFDGGQTEREYTGPSNANETAES